MIQEYVLDQIMLVIGIHLAIMEMMKQIVIPDLAYMIVTSVVVMGIVFDQTGSVMVAIIVEMDQMKLIVLMIVLMRVMLNVIQDAIDHMNFVMVTKDATVTLRQIVPISLVHMMEITAVHKVVRASDLIKSVMDLGIAILEMMNRIAHH